MTFEAPQPNLEDVLRLFENRLNSLYNDMKGKGEITTSSETNETAGDFLRAIESFVAKDPDAIDIVKAWVEGAIDPDLHLGVDGEGNQAVLTLTLKEEE